MIVVVS